MSEVTWFGERFERNQEDCSWTLVLLLLRLHAIRDIRVGSWLRQSLHEEVTRLAKTRLAQNSLNYKINSLNHLLNSLKYLET